MINPFFTNSGFFMLLTEHENSYEDIPTGMSLILIAPGQAIVSADNSLVAIRGFYSSEDEAREAYKDLKVSVDNGYWNQWLEHWKRCSK